MPRGASPKREREYEKLKKEFKQEGRYKGREKEVASRIVNKQRAQYGETKGHARKERKGETEDRNLPIKGYKHLTIPQIKTKLDKLSKGDLKKIQRFEEQHKSRKGVLNEIEKRAA